MAAWIIRLSPGAHDTVTALPAALAVGVDRPHVRTHQAGAALRFVDGGDAELAERLDGAGVGALNVSNDGRFHATHLPLLAALVIRGYTFRALPSKIFCFGPRRVERGRGVDVALRVVVVLARFRIDAAHGADHLRAEQDVVDRHDLRQQVDAGLMVDAGVEEDVVANHVGEQRPLHVLREAAIAAPVIRHGAAAVRDDECAASGSP